MRTRWSETADEYCDVEGVNLLTAHLFMMKRGADRPEEPDGEKPIMIGNADMIYTDCIPKQIQYTALGHLHAYRNIESPQKPIVYSSSPLCYSFSEAGQTKYVAIVELKPGQVAEVNRVELTQGRQLFRKLFSNADDAVEWLTEHPNALVELTMETESFLTADERARIYQAHDGIIYLIPKVKLAKVDDVEDKSINLNQDMPDLFADYFKSKHKGQAPNEEMMSLFHEILNADK